MTTTQRVYFTMFLHPLNGWTRVGPAYVKCETAVSWVPFVRSARRGLKTKVAQCTLRYGDGVMDDASRTGARREVQHVFGG